MWATIKQTIKRDASISRGLVVGGILLLIQLGLTAGFSWRLPEEIPLYYSQAADEQQLSQSSWFLILPILGAVFYLSQFLLLGFTGNMVKVLGEIIIWFTDVSLLMITLAMIHILMLVY